MSGQAEYVIFLFFWLGMALLTVKCHALKNEWKNQGRHFKSLLAMAAMLLCGLLTILTTIGLVVETVSGTCRWWLSI